MKCSILLFALAIGHYYLPPVRAQWSMFSSGDPFNQLNDYLIEKLPRDSRAEPNVQAARNLLGKLSAIISTNGGTGQQTDSNPIIEVLERFVALEGITEENICSQESFDALERVFKLLHNYQSGKTRATQGANARRRVNKILIRLSERRFRSCIDKISRELEDNSTGEAQQTTSLRDRNIKQVVHYLYETRHGKHLFHLPLLVDALDEATEPVGGTTNGLRLALAIKDLMAIDKRGQALMGQAEWAPTDERTGKYTLDKEGTGQLVDNYVLASCRDYVADESPAMKYVKQARVTFDQLVLREDLFPARPNFRIKNLVMKVINLVACERLLLSDQQRVVEAVYKWFKQRIDQLNYTN